MKRKHLKRVVAGAFAAVMEHLEYHFHRQMCMQKKKGMN